MKKSELKNIIRESIKELTTEQQTGPYQLGPFTVNIGDTVYIAIAGGPNIIIPNNLPPQPKPSTPHATNQDMYAAIFANSGPLQCPSNLAGGTTSNLCCMERAFKIDTNNISCLQGNYFNGSTPKPGVYISMTQGSVSGMNVAINQCSYGNTGGDYPYVAIPAGLEISGPGMMATNPGYGCLGSYTPPPPPPVLPIFGCTAMTAANYDPNADGCENSAGLADPNDYSCCIAPPGGATNFGQSISSLDKFNTDMAFEPKTPSIEPEDPSDDIPKLQKRAGIRKER